MRRLQHQAGRVRAPAGEDQVPAGQKARYKLGANPLAKALSAPIADSVRSVDVPLTAIAGGKQAEVSGPRARCTYCDEHRLTPRQRLELLVPVCQAIQHAHHKGIIHRDLKPSNVLVSLYDDRPVPKVIDFGVAKATGTLPPAHRLPKARRWPSGLNATLITSRPEPVTVGRVLHAADLG
jgi:hypothetical protein